jgi:hypothetical protein
MNFPGARGATYDGAPVSGGGRNQPNAIAQMRIKKEKKAARELAAAVGLARGAGTKGGTIADVPSVVPSFAPGDASGPGGPSFAPGLHRF